MRRKRHELIPQASLDDPFGPPPEEYLYRCSVCGEEMLVNEAIIDVAIGAAKFRGNIKAGCRRLGVPDATARPWSTWIKSHSPPVGRYVQYSLLYRVLRSIHQSQKTSRYR